ncbi:MAG TPA: mercury methylation ferredoxin HgcB [Dissulfurispiraceae bacterium]|nr:mercury methylation ferredoxin HgcB [Dissulfurispiraceae bacterium]
MKYLSGSASIEFFPDRCTGCGMCIEVCPHNVFIMLDGKASVHDRDSCMECGACANNCAFNALSVAKGVGCATAIINSMLYGGEPSCDCNSGGKKNGCC